MKRIIIMGASSGIGHGLAEYYLKSGFTVGLAARRTDSLQALADKYPQQVQLASIDITKPQAVKDLCLLADKLEGIDTYIHVAGIGYDDPDLDPEREASFIDTNAVGFARMISAAYNYFKNNKMAGHIVAVTSVAGTKGIGGMAAYSASKKCASTYLVALQQLAHAEHVDVKITDIRPGWIRTALVHDDLKYPLETTLERAIPLIVRAITRSPRVAIIGWRWRLVVALWRLLPTWLWVRLPLSLAAPQPLNQ